jgi:hypothetical protein
MRVTIDFDSAGNTVRMATPTGVVGQSVTTETISTAATLESGLDAGACSAVVEARPATTEEIGRNAAPDSSLNAGGFSASRTEPQSPRASRDERNVVSIAEPPPPPHADEFGLGSRAERREGAGDAGSFKG